VLAVLLFVAVICSFSFFAAVKLNRTFEETLPISAMGIILFLFLTGMVNILGIGWILVCIIAVGLYGYSIYWLIKKHSRDSLKESCFNLFTPGFIVFAILTVMIAYFNQDRLATHTDEFSHWMDIVMIMTGINGFGTTAGSGAIFPSYPPAMSLFQYLMEKINMAITGDFSEWKVYFAYQLLAVSIMLPFVKVKGHSVVQKVVSVISWPVCLFLPLLFFKDMYSSIYIDPFLGVLGGSGFAAVSITKKKDWMYNTYMSMLMAVLVLSKDVGIYLAIFISIYYLIDYLSREGFGKKNILLSATPLAAMILAKLLWKIELAVSHTAQKFSQPFDVQGTIDTIKGNGNEFYTTVYDNFRQAITYRFVYYERLGFNYTSIMTLLVVAFICLHVSLYKRGQLKKAAAITGAVVPGIAIIFYILSMFPLYISRFETEEAINLASFERYCGIMFLTGILLMFWLLRDMLIDADGKVVPVVLAAGMLASVYHSQKDIISDYTSRRTVLDSQDYRANVNALAGKINEVCEDDARILLVYSDGESLMEAILTTLTKPRTIDSSEGYIPNITPEDGNIITSTDLLGIIKDNYDYLAVYSGNGCLTVNYLDLFQDGKILNCSIYKINNQTGKLELVR
jgi:hypothetical protein